MIKKRQIEILTANFTGKKGTTSNAVGEGRKVGDSLVTGNEQLQSPLKKNGETSGKSNKKSKKQAFNPFALLAQSGLTPAEQLAFLKA